MRPRIRTLKPDFFGDEKIVKLPVGSRYVAVGLVSAADDRGRIWRTPALRTFVFPLGDISEKQFDRAVDDIVRVGFAWAYEADEWSYLWLPNFWKHQVINKPSESSLPPHPRDPHGGLPIREALADFRNVSGSDTGLLRENSGNGPGSLPPSRVGARSIPFPSVVDDLCQRLANHVRANDPKAAPRPQSDRWRTDMRLLLVDRDDDAAEVARIIDWCQADSFWRSNILSPGKLRKQFTQLLLKAAPGNGKVIAMRPAALERADAWMAGYEEDAS